MIPYVPEAASQLQIQPLSLSGSKKLKGMTISYTWLSEYLPQTVEPEKLSKILTSLGLEVESLERYESVKGGLQGLVVGQVISREKHPDAEKLSVTRVDIGKGEPLQIVCGAPNVAQEQKVIVALVGTTLYPSKSEPITMKVAKIRGVESHGMICAEDEIGLGEGHEGILVLPADAKVGRPAAELFQPYSDWIFEIGLTPNRMDAMSHLGVARDVCAWFNHHNKKECRAKAPNVASFKADNNSLLFKVTIENKDACQRYSGVSIKGITIGESPKWMQEKLKAIGVRPINNIVDITNYVLHETGQPLHAFDADQVQERTIIVKNLPTGTPFVSLDEKERKLTENDLMICDGKQNPMCIAGIFGGLKSGVTNNTKNIFLESAWFNPVNIRRSSFYHNLRTDAATHFEKNIDISNTVNVLKRAAIMIKEIAGGQIASEVIDVYPQPREKMQIQLKYHYLRKLSGKLYHPDTVKKILSSLGFEVSREGVDGFWVTVPFSKPDITIPADVVEEIMRVDGYDNIEIPQSISITPSIEVNGYKQRFTEKVAGFLVGAGFHEIVTNSITNGAFFNEQELARSVRMLNSLSAELDTMRPSMLETGLNVIAHNLNRKNSDLKLFEFGKTYARSKDGHYLEADHLTLYVTGQVLDTSWKEKSKPSDIFYMKGLADRILRLLGVNQFAFEASTNDKLRQSVNIIYHKKTIATIGSVQHATLSKFDVRQPVFFLDIMWQEVLLLTKTMLVQVLELPKQLPVHRDLAMVVGKSMAYGSIEKTIRTIGLSKLKEVQLFDIFESEKIGHDKKSLAISFTFLDEEKTLTDKEIDGMMSKIITSLENNLQAQIRSN
jgi:phenylalanyl-tRNA synthetase beta chain